MPTSFKALAELCEKLESTKKRLLMIDLVANFLRNLDVQEIEPSISMILGRPFPKWSSQSLEVSWATISEMIKRITEVEWNVFMDAFNKT
jgi:hypothetical protein